MSEENDEEKIRYLHPLIVSQGALKRQATKERCSDEILSISKNDVDEYLAEGWQVDKELIRVTKVKRAKSHDHAIESKVWYFLYLLGYPELSKERNFRIKIERKGAEPLYKQIDVFAKDGETVLVFECKSSKKHSKRSLQKDLEEFASLKKPIANAIKKHYGSDFKPKILFFFVTEKIQWSAPDKERANGLNILRITERELSYLLQIADHLRSAARFQFLAEYLAGVKIPELEGVKVPAIEGKLGGNKFFSFVTTPRQLLKIAFVNHRSLNDPDGAPSYQRLVSRTRLRQVSKFIFDGGYFPNNIIINFTQRSRFEKSGNSQVGEVRFGSLILPSKYRSAWVVDGQHRLYGYAPLSDKYLDQNIFVIAFDGLSKVEEANMFVTINSQQKAVKKTLLDDLEGELKWGSTIPSERIGAITARLINVMNTDVGEALYGRVTQQDIKATSTACLTVPALKDALKRSKLIGSVYKRKEYQSGPFTGLTDSETLERSRVVLHAYFDLISNAHNRQWDRGKQGHLCTNVAIQGQILLLGSLIGYIESDKALNARELEVSSLIAEIEEYFEPVVAWLEGKNDEEMSREFKVVLGSGGPSEYYYKLCRIIAAEFPDFKPDGFDKWLISQSSEKTAETDKRLKDLNIRVHKAIFSILKDEFGEDYWEKGVTDKKIKTRAYEKSLEEDSTARLSLDNYLDFIEFKKVVETKSVWPLFQKIFNISEDGSKGSQKNLKWMENINELRRKPAHATEQRTYTADEMEYVEMISSEFGGRYQERFGNYDAV